MTLPPIYQPSNTSLIQQHAKVFLGATDFTAFGTATLTRGAKGKYYWAVGNTQTVEFVASLKKVLRNFVPATVNYNYASPNAPISLNNVTAIYQVGTAALTTGTVSVSKTTFGPTLSQATPTVVDLLAPTAIVLTASADIQLATLTPANPALLPLATDELSAEIIVTTPGTSTFELYGLLLDIMYNV